MGGRRSNSVPAPDVEAQVVVVTPGGDKRRGGQQCLHLEPDQIAIEAQSLRDVAYVQVQVPDAQAVADRSLQAFFEHRDEPLRVQRSRPAVIPEVRRPLVARTVGGELDAVTVGISQIDRFMGAVVGGPLDRRLGLDQARSGSRQLQARGVQERVVIKARVTTCRAGLRVLMEHYDRTSAVAHFGGADIMRVHPQSEHALIPLHRVVERGDDQVHRP